MTGAINNYLAMCNDEVINAARLKAYVDNGIVPDRFSVTATGCDGLVDILPCVDSDAPAGGYTLPELDPAPWYDAAAPESKNFAGLLVTSVTMSSPYTRTVTRNITSGATLGRLKTTERTIVVTGWLIGKTCCATQYGLRWLTSVLGDSPCLGANGCGGCDIDFLLCCPSIGGGDNDCLNFDNVIFTRPDEDSEYERASDFFRRMHDVGVISGPEVLDCRGSSCGCGCGSMLQVEFTLVAANPYIYTIGETMLDAEPLATCDTLDVCDAVWVVCAAGDPALDCTPTADCADDPLNPLPPLPPQPSSSVPQGPGGVPLQSARLCVSVAPVKDWSTSTLNIDIFAGDSDLRNVLVQIYSNPTGRDCDDPAFDQCAACSSVLFSFIPAGGTLRFSGENRTATIECAGQIRSAFSSLSAPGGGAFDWPDLACQDSCVCITSDCNNMGTGATVTITRVDRDL